MYAPPITFEIKVNIIAHGALVELTLFPMGLVFGMGPLIKKIVCLYGFLPSSVPVG